MQLHEKLFLLAILLVVLFELTVGFGNGSNFERRRGLTASNQPQIEEPPIENRTNPTPVNQPQQECPIIKSIQFTTTDNKGNDNEQGANYVLIFDPKSQDLDFKVSMGLAHELYAKDAKGKFRKDYTPKTFREILTEENAKLKGKPPIAAINGDAIDKKNQPQGLNISRGVEYSGAFKYKRSSFGISGAKPEKRRATIQIGRRKEELLNYNVVGGNGRFYRNGKFKDICQDLGDYGCGEETSRSLVAITSNGYVILLVNNANLKQALYPSMFDDVLRGIAYNYCLGRIREGMLFDGGFSTNLYFDNKIYVENSHPIGSAFLIYKK